MTDGVYKEIREHQARIEELRRADAKHEARLDGLDTRVNAIMTDLAAMRGESRQQHNETIRELTKLSTTMRMIFWLVPLVVASVGVAVKLFV